MKTFGASLEAVVLVVFIALLASMACQSPDKFRPIEFKDIKTSNGSSVIYIKCRPESYTKLECENAIGEHCKGGYTIEKEEGNPYSNFYEIIAVCK